jgi:hypothetical protein
MPRGNGGFAAAMRAISNLSQPISTAATSTATAAIIKRSNSGIWWPFYHYAQRKNPAQFAAERGCAGAAGFNGWNLKRRGLASLRAPGASVMVESALPAAAPGFPEAFLHEVLIRRLPTRRARSRGR